MSDVTSVSAVLVEPTLEVRRRTGLGVVFWASVGWLVVVVTASFAAPWLPLADPDAYQIETGQPPPYAPSWRHWFGTDQDARDMFSRTVHGARTSLLVGVAAMMLGLVVGGTLGMVAGYLRGAADRAANLLFILLLSFPSLVLAILVTSVLDRTIVSVSMTIGILAIAPVGQVARSTTRSVAEREFVLAAQAVGATRMRILRRELLPNIVGPMLSLSLIGVAVAVVAEGSLAFLGLSVEEGTTWGELILLGTGRRELEQAPWIALAPSLALFSTVLALNLAADRLQARRDRPTVGD